MTFAEKIKKLRKDNRMTQKDLAKMLGVVPTAVSAWEQGKNKPLMDKITIMSNRFNIPISYFFEADDSYDASVQMPRDSVNIKTLPLYGNVAAGAIAEIEGVDVWNVETLDIPSVMLGRYANDDHLFSMYVNGDSMDKVIPSGAIIAVKTLDDYLYKDGDIVIFSNHGEYSLKRYRPNMIDGFVVFEPDSNNADFKNIAINNTALYEADEVSIYGKVIFFSTTL